ncbi:fasciclin domain-containing protein [Acuticoccus sp.]|uniref:fasciclin domain-containing protein n=1 Tax=Acuticoccus sp. TaxID=1904378 RepID=UPI003B5274E5
MRTILAAAFTLAFAAAPVAAAENFRSALEAKGNYATFLKALEASDAGWFLEEDEAYTAFVPTDAAFDALPDGVLDALLREENRPKLNAILEHHVLPDVQVTAADLSDGRSLDVAGGEPLEVSIEGSAVTVDKASVTEPDIDTDAGIVHGIDAVLVPEIVVEAMKFTGDYPTN